MRILGWFFFGLAIVGLTVGLVGDIWGGITYDNLRGWDKNPGRYPWLIGLIAAASGTVASFLAATFGTWDQVKLAKNQKVMLTIQGLMVAGVLEFVYALVVYFQRAI
jgi:MFS family permease